MASSCALLHLLVIILLAFSCFFPFNAMATSRNMDLLYESQELPTFKDISQVEPSEMAELEGEEFGSRRMDFQSNDYLGSGANNRHTPRPPVTLEGRKS
ncbi:hypothetical protein M9H77_09965 [Catharanthus roseus]|uniref:Uncharacterized protein n=1 Tax=Catharanthus roseus TaxID=4058 RepID=A0ACC0C292_CATRO|nr:hypothetical protein M9H77_09965 [Catharanthus roseus]